MRPLVFILCLLTGTPTLFAQSSPIDTLTCGDTLFAEYNPQLGGSLEDTLLAWVGNCQSTIRFDFYTANVPDAADIYYVDQHGNEQFVGSLPYFGGNCYVNNYFFDSTQYPLSTAMNEQNCLPGFVEMYGQGYPFQDSIRRRMSLPSDFKFASSFQTSARLHLRMPEGMWGVKFIVRSHSTNYSFLKILWDCSPEACITAAAEPACVGDSVQLSALEEAYSYQWQGPAGFISAEKNPVLPDVQLSQSGWYVLTGQYLGGLSGVDSVWVAVTAPVATISPDTAFICQGGSATLLAQGGVSALWHPSGTSDLQVSGMQAQASPGQATEYQVEVTDAQGCKATASAWVIPTAMEVQPLGIDPSCQGLSNGEIQVQHPGGQAPFNLRIDGGDWQPGLTYGGLAAGSYLVEVQDAQGCTGQEQILLTEPEELILMAGTQSPTCEGACNAEVLLMPMGGTAPYQYRWEGLAVDSVVSGICAGKFEAKLMDSQGCEAIEEVEIEKGAAFRIKLKGDTRVRERELVTLRVESPQLLAEISWPGHCEAGCLPELSFLPDSNQWVWVEARSEEGCLAQDSAFVRLKKRVQCIEGIYAPNAFSPNGDGVNEGFTLYADQIGFLQVS
ncbi:MAG: hypothetical protein AAFR61_04180, partial [Bacteroidota bacterium]